MLPCPQIFGGTSAKTQFGPVPGVREKASHERAMRRPSTISLGAGTSRRYGTSGCVPGTGHQPSSRRSNNGQPQTPRTGGAGASSERSAVSQRLVCFMATTMPTASTSIARNKLHGRHEPSCRSTRHRRCTTTRRPLINVRRFGSSRSRRPASGVVIEEIGTESASSYQNLREYPSGTKRGWPSRSATSDAKASPRVGRPTTISGARAPRLLRHVVGKRGHHRVRGLIGDQGSDRVASVRQLAQRQHEHAAVGQAERDSRNGKVASPKSAPARQASAPANSRPSIR